MGRCCRTTHCWTGALGLALVLLLGAVPASADGGDPAVAQFLLKEGKKAISLRKWDEAIRKLERAREEDPTLLEATYLAATAYEKKKDPAGALAAYRSFRDGCAERERTRKLDRKLVSLRKKAEKRIALLGKGEKELEKLQSGFARRLIVFAVKHAEKDADIAAYALRRLLAVLPLHEEATQLLAKITGESAVEDDDDVPIPGITKWDDLLGRRSIESGAKVSYKRGILTIDSEGGTIYWHDGRTEAPATFVYDMEFRFLEDHSPGFLLGFSFARRKSRGGDPESFVSCFVQKSNAALIQGKGGRNVELGESSIKPVAKGTWRRFTVAADGRKVRAFLDGKRVLNSTIPGTEDLAGQVGMFHQRCKVEIRKLRLGTKE